MIPLFSVTMPPREELLPELEKVLYSGYIGQGPKVEEFEKDFASYLGIDTGKVLSVNSGTSALHLALRLANVQGGEVITTPMTCTATNWPILANGADIVWADIDPETGMISIQDIARKFSDRTRAIVIVHWGGMPARLGPILEFARMRNIPVIEDAAHALGAEWYDLKIGQGTARFTCFSFQAIKHITTVDGGVLVCNRESDYKRGKLLRWYGIDRDGERKDFRCEEDVKEWGYKFHMNDVNATIGIIALKHLPEILEKHRQNALFYEFNITNPLVKKPKGYIEGHSSWWLYTLRVHNRDSFMEYMKQCGVMVSRVHERNDIHTVTKKFMTPLPGVDKFVSEMVCIPVHSKLSVEELSWIAIAVNGWKGEF
jgi:dTDP-4-amino-4,6-dideoxygalactose transaminase